MAATAPPRKRLPVSPMKHLAGWWLYPTTKARSPPRRAEAKSPRVVSSARSPAARKKTQVTAVTLPARPSMPSVRFTALTQPTMTKAAKTR